ncbi:MAG: alcohol dehydrogenase catalytic domain-containing protein [Kibdelosporangium sp.]
MTVPARMLAAIFHGGTDIRVEEVAMPMPLADDDVVVKVLAAGVCGSDVLAYRSLGPWQHSPDHPGQDGHELAGEIAAVGTDVGWVRVGDRVAVEPIHLLSCGQCAACVSGRTHLCMARGLRGGKHVHSHGFAQYDRCPASRVHLLPDNVSVDEAALLDCYACAVHALHLAPIDGPIVVLGCGTIALTMGQVARAAGHRVVLTGTHADALALAIRSGAADVTVNVTTDELAPVVAAETHGLGASVVIDAVGDPKSTLEQALGVLAPGGQVTVLGVYPSTPQLDPHRAYVTEATVQWSNSYGSCQGQSEFAIALALLATGRVDAASLITHRFPLPEIDKAFRAMTDKAITRAVKVLVQPHVP